MALQTRNKINPQWNMASMTDLIFLLLIFFVLTSTFVSPNALKLLLPKSASQTLITPPVIAVSIDKNLNFYVGLNKVKFEELELTLQTMLQGYNEPTISLHAEKSVPIEYVVKVMNIANKNRYKLILATQPE